MNEPQSNRWMALCEQATIEEDPHKLAELLKEIDSMLEVREKQLRAERATRR